MFVTEVDKGDSGGHPNGQIQGKASREERRDIQPLQ